MPGRYRGCVVLVDLRDLVVRAQQGDGEAFGALAQAQANRLYAIAYRILRDADLAGDALQDTLVHTWRELPGLRDPDKFDAWACRITCRVCYRLARRERRRSAHRLMELPGLSPPREAVGEDSDALADRDELERGFRRPSASVPHRG